MESILHFLPQRLTLEIRDLCPMRVFAAFPGEEVMANINDGRTPVGVWGRRIAFCCFGVVSATIILIALAAAVLIASGVLGW
jgi:hypothetical protein